ncbi:MAG: hypothetical protein QXW79_01335 [Thermoplasmata archaeon]
MSRGIIRMINKKFTKYLKYECLDIIQIKNICSLYKKKTVDEKSISPSEIDFSSPEKIETTDFGARLSSNNPKIRENDMKKEDNILKSKEFVKKYKFIIKVLYVCLKIDVDIFDIGDNMVTIKNNYQLIKSLINKKRKLIMEHINVLREHYQNIEKQIDVEYENYHNSYLSKIRLVDKLINYINKLVDFGILKKTDNLLTLILPYFYNYTKYIEEYN